MLTVPLIIIVLMILLSAFFSGMEIAFTSKNRLRLEIDRKQSRMFDFVADVFARNPGQYITTILVGNNIALVVYSLMMSIAIRAVVDRAGWSTLSGGMVLIETVISTLLIIFLAEFLPKTIFRSNANFYYKALSPLIYLFYLILYPVAKLTTLISHTILRILGQRNNGDSDDSGFDRTDLADLLDTNPTDSSHESESEIKLFQNALDFADLRVRDCMVPRVDVEAIDLENSTIQQLTDRFVESQYSRIFVWQGSIDNIVGYVNSKRLFATPTTMDELVTPVQCVAETMPLQLMLQHFMKHKNKVAVVIDEFGGTAGIISLEDVLEQIFGEIEDEHDVPDLIEQQISETEFVLSCRLEVKYLNEKYSLDIEENKEYDTLAGFIIYNHGGIPQAGEELEFGGLYVKILRTTRSRLELAKVKKI